MSEKRLAMMWVVLVMAVAGVSVYTGWRFGHRAGLEENLSENGVLPAVQNGMMPVWLTPRDIEKVYALKLKGDTYERFAERDGRLGVLAVRMPGGWWLTPTTETGGSSGATR